MTVTDERWLGKMALQRPQAWQDRAACKDAVIDGVATGPDNDPWFPRGNKELAAKALAYCQSCPVVLQCEIERRRIRINEGVWAGRVHTRIDHAMPARDMRSTPLNEVRRDRYDAGMTDRQMAEIEGVRRETIGWWRQHFHLPANPDIEGRAASVLAARRALADGDGEIERRIELHARGLTDTEISIETGTPRSTISNWRHRRGLPRNKPRN